MNNRRNFIKTSLLLTAGVATTLSATEEKAKEEPQKTEVKKEEVIVPKGIFYSTAEQGRWKGKDGSHAPVITVDGKKVTIETKHSMSEAHYIVKHMLLTTEGEVLGEMVFFPKDKKAISTFELKEVPTHLVATSFCNLHDLWITEYKA
jgi:superoxide reductase